MPQMLRDILEHVIQLQYDCELLKDASRGFHRRQHAVSPDVIILGLHDDDDETLVPGLFARWPTTQVITVMQADDGATVYELRPSRRPLGNVSPSELIDALRAMVGQHRDLPEE